MTDHNKRRSLVGAAATALLSILLLAIVNVVYTQSQIEETKKQLRYEQAERGRVICGVLNVSKKPRPTPPAAEGSVQPVTPYGKKLAKYNEEVQEFDKYARREVTNLSNVLNCPKGDSK